MQLDSSINHTRMITSGDGEVPWAYGGFVR
jgi:hypothetical protein